MSPRRPVATVNVLEALRRRYCAPAYAFVEQVGTTTGFANRGYCDALALSLWPSRGLHLYGFEVKVSRSDWIRERDNPEKAERFFERCHLWSIVAPPGIVEISELPPGWGLLEVGGRLITRREARLREVPAPDWGFLAAILRRAAEAEGARAGDVERLVEIRAKAIVAEKAERAGAPDHQIKARLQEADSLRLEVDEFEKASGLRISVYPGGKDLGRAVDRLRRLDSTLAGYRAEASKFASSTDQATRAFLALLEERGSEIPPAPE